MPRKKQEQEILVPEVSTIVRVNHRRHERETEKTILTANNTSVRTAPDGSLIIELFRYGKDEEPIESYQFKLAPVDRERVKRIA